MLENLLPKSVYLPSYRLPKWIQYNYNAGGNAVTFNFNGNSQLVSNISWYVEETGQQLGNGWFSLPLIVPNPCGNRTISVKYFEGGAWKICCKKVTLCNPNDCSTNIVHEITNGILGLKIDTSYHDITWYVDTTFAGTGNAVTYNLNGFSGQVTVTVIYRNPATGCYQTCTKSISIVNCLQPTAVFTYTTVGNTVSFSNQSKDATSYNWNFAGGTAINGTSSSSKEPVAIFPSGNYNVCLVATNLCGAKTYCQELKIINGQECTFTLSEQVCGKVGDEVIVPVKVNRFTDVLTFNFTIKIADTAKVEILGLTQFDPTIQAGSYSFTAADQVRFFWSDAIGKSLPDSTTIFGVKVKIKAAFTNTIPIEFSNIPVKIEGFDKDLKALAISTKNGSICTSSTVILAGTITTPENLPVGTAKVDISGSHNLQKTTAVDGLFDFAGLQNGGNYLLKPGKNIEPLNGVNALDIVRLQRHLLFLDLLNTPYKLIAADVNNDKVINALDIVILQRLQLRLIDSFPNNQSWRFVPKAYNFFTSNPLTENYPEAIDYNPLTVDRVNQDFFGIKIGDLNSSANPSDVQSTKVEIRGTADTVKLNLASKYVLPGAQVAVPITVKFFKQIVALQGTFQWDTSVLQFQTTSNYLLPNMAPSNFATPFKKMGILTFTWLDGSTQGITLADDVVLFHLNFKVVGKIGSQSLVELTNTPLETLAVDPALAEVPVDGLAGLIQVMEPLSFGATVNPVRCFAGSDGAIALQVTGGTTGYTYQWSNQDSTQSIANLSAGSYTCTITDVASGFSIVTTPFVIDAPTKLESNIQKQNDPATNKVVLEAKVNGGTPPYVYYWSNGQNTQTITNLSDGIFGLTVTDANGCITRSTLSLTTDSKEIEIDQIKIYPNPSNGEVHIDLNLPVIECKYTWTLQNMIGQNVLKGTILDCKQFVIDTGQQAEGMYQLRLTGDGKTLSFPIILTSK